MTNSPKYIRTDLPPQTIPGFVLWQVSKLWQRKLTLALKEFGIGSTEVVVLGNVVRLKLLGQQATQPMLTEITKIDRMTCSQTLHSLIAKKLIVRKNLDADRRTFYILPTKAGIKLADVALGKVIKAHTEFFEPLKGKPDQFLAIMQSLLEKNDQISTN